MDFFSLLSLERQSKKENLFSWKIYTETLQIVLKKEPIESLSELVDEFILITDLIDDLMDKDRPIIHEALLTNQDELVNYLFSVLNEIEEIVSEASFKKFMDYILKALDYQHVESRYKLSTRSTEADYFELVNRSVFLMQSIIFLVDSSPSSSLLNAIRYFAMSAQISNDLEELKKEEPFDIIDGKGTLPLIKTIEWAQQQNHEEIVHNLLTIDRLNVTSEKLNLIIKQINDSPSVAYCRLLQLSYEKKAKAELVKGEMEGLSSSLFIEDTKEDSYNEDKK